jgi:ATP-dependent DNA ligase
VDPRSERATRQNAGRIKARSFTIDGEAVVVGPDGLSRFEALRRREAAHTVILYAFDLIEHGTYRSGPCPVWIKVRNPACSAMQRDRSEKWNRIP